MAGHSQFKNIMHRKGAQDAKRAKIFTKIGKEISVAVKTGGGPEPALNPKLRAALVAARNVNMPKDNIEKAIKKASGDNEGADFEAITYEGYGPFGVAIIVETLTDNRNRTAADIRAIFNKHNGNLGTTGSVNYLFTHCGIIKFNHQEVKFDEAFEAAVAMGAADVTEEPDYIVIKTPNSDLHKISEALAEKFKVSPAFSGLEWQANTEIPLNEEQAAALIKMLHALEDNDDVQEVFSNFTTSLEVLQKLNQ